LPPTADGKRLKIALSLLDSGFRPKDVHGLIERAKKRGIKLVPCRGSTRSLGPGVMYEKRRLGKTRPGPARPTCWSTRATRKTGSIGSCTTRGPASRRHEPVRAELGEHQDYLEQLLNEAPVDEQWQIVDENVPVDYRDAKRYAAVAMLLRTRGKEIKEPGARQESGTEAGGRGRRPPSRPRKTPRSHVPLTPAWRLAQHAMNDERKPHREPIPKGQKLRREVGRAGGRSGPHAAGFCRRMPGNNASHENTRVYRTRRRGPLLRLRRLRPHLEEDRAAGWPQAGEGERAGAGLIDLTRCTRARVE
jgi:hypothetical protein